MSVEERVRTFIHDELGYVDAYDWSSHEDLIATGVLDSIAIVHLTCFLEAEFGLRLFDQDLDPRDLVSIDGVVLLVRSRAHDTDAALDSPPAAWPNGTMST